MDEIELYLYSRCSSCRNADRLLQELGVSPKTRDFFRDRFTREELVDLIQRTGLTPADLVSTRSKPYRELGLGNRNLSSDELVDLMVEHPQLLKRPLLLKNGQTVTGFNRGAIEALVRGEN